MARALWIGMALPLALTQACLGETLELAPENDSGAFSDAGADAHDAGGNQNAKDAALCAGKNCLGGACVDDVCQPALIATPEQDIVPFGIAVDPSTTGGVYYTTYTARSVLRVDKWGSPSEVVFVTSWWNDMIDVQLDDHRLYFSAYHPNQAPVYAMNETDAEPIELGDSNPHGAWFITFDESYVYWANRDDVEAIVRAPKVDGPREVILTKTNPTDGAAGIAIDGDTLYYGMQHDTGGWIGMVNKAGGSPIVLTGATPRALRVGGDFVYWNEPTSVKRMKKDGTGSVVTLDSGTNIASIGLDDGYAYWTDQSEGTLRRKPIAGGASETLATNQLQPTMIAFDEVAIYWTNQAGGVMKLAK